MEKSFTAKCQIQIVWKNSLDRVNQPFFVWSFHCIELNSRDRSKTEKSFTAKPDLDYMEEFFGSRESTVLRVLVPLYSTKQASRCFYQKLVEIN